MTNGDTIKESLERGLAARGDGPPTYSPKKPEAAPELRPPQEHAGRSLHWLEYQGTHAVAIWSGYYWHCVEDDRHQGPPDYMAKEGYRYLGPAEWRDPAEADFSTLPMQHATLGRNFTRLEAEFGRQQARIAALEDQVRDARAVADAVVRSDNRVNEQLYERVAKLEAENTRLTEQLGMQVQPATAAPLPLQALKGGDGRPK